MNAASSLHAVLTSAQMREADRRTVDSGTSGADLMERAGEAVAAEILRRWPVGRAAVLCGPGNNGGDGFVAARHLDDAGWRVDVALLGERNRLTGDAARMASRWRGPVSSLAGADFGNRDVIIDALFGIGLSRDFDANLAARIGAAGAPVVAADIPSGVDGDSGRVRGGAVRADLTIAFCRRKPGHMLYPGRGLCGEVVVADIGVADAAVASVKPSLARNAPGAWRRAWPWPDEETHKYARGHLIVTGGGMATSGAARLAARAGLRAGAGLATCAVPESALPVYAAHLTAAMVEPVSGGPALRALMAERRASALLAGPGQGVGEATRGLVLAGLATRTPAVLDADALTTFRDDPDALFARLSEACVLTPHEGEFARLFPRTGDRLGDVAEAARKAGCTVVLKGPDTAIAEPDGSIVINDNAPPDLATAGSGDVLAGFVAGLLAQGAGAFDAACMGVWLHGETGRRAGPGLIAEDLPEAAPHVLGRLRRGMT